MRRSENQRERLYERRETAAEEWAEIERSLVNKRVNSLNQQHLTQKTLRPADRKFVSSLKESVKRPVKGRPVRELEKGNICKLLKINQ